jgi:hypothetical protein
MNIVKFSWAPNNTSEGTKVPASIRLAISALQLSALALLQIYS